ncbi:hypothetical protein [Rhizobium brockwellii]|uniref:hypothetical protein n=1 Tax=Rhizobium TaxID=379 RepID=UPI0013EECBDE|nr:hypothetical protein [Rhizobium leguminosarum]
MGHLAKRLRLPGGGRKIAGKGAKDRGPGKDHLWHSGVGNSSSVPPSRKPLFDLIAGDVQSSRLKFIPGVERLLSPRFGQYSAVDLKLIILFG